MADCKLMFYDARAAKLDGKKMTFIDWLILLRSDPYIHVEFVFSVERYGGISNSATLRDGCKCVRFKDIDLAKHPKRWKGVVIPMTDEEEDRAWKEACEMAGLPGNWRSHPKSFMEGRICYYDYDAIPYDIWGMPCHISKWNIWKPNPKKTWCSKAVARVLSKGKEYSLSVALALKLHYLRAEIMPTQLFNLAEGYFSPMDVLE